MKNKKEKVFEFVQKMVYTDPTCSEGVETYIIADTLEMQRSNVSALLNELIKEGKLEKTNTRPVLYRLPKQSAQSINNSCFDNLIGHNGSLRNAIQLAKAAILYPSSSLNVLLSSKPGCGTTCFASAMFEFAKEEGILSEDAPYVKINCKHYSKNVAVLNDELFGAGDDLSTSCFAKAQNGMLFIDNVDLLDAKQQSLIFEFIETGKIYSDDRSTSLHVDKVFLVLACAPQSSNHLNNRIPVTIELPELNNRPLQERFELINHFFSIEASNADRCIEVHAEALKALLLSDFNFGVKELNFEIMTACANAYVRVVNDMGHNIYVISDDLTKPIKSSLIRMKEKGLEIDSLLGSREVIYYDKSKGFQSQITISEENYLYSEIKKQYEELSNRGINDSSIENVINTHVQNLFKEYSYQEFHDETNNLEQLSKIVNHDVIMMVQEWLDQCKEQLGKNYKANVFYGLCLHINSLLTMNHTMQRVDNDQIVKIIQDYPKEYAASAKFVSRLAEKFGLDLKIDEVVLITMFLLEPEEPEETGHPVLLYIMHGNSAARSLKDVTNALTHTHNAYSYDLALDSESGKALEEIKSLILSIDEGAGVIVIYDMGSIKTMIETISEEIDVKIRCLNIPLTLIGIDMARRCSMESDIDYIHHIANLELQNLNHRGAKQTSVIVTLCHTGEGGAIQLKNYIDQYSKLGMKTVPLCISNRQELIKEVQALQKAYRIHAFVGTYDPKLLGVPFISITKVFEYSKDDIDKILQFEPVQKNTFNYDAVYAYLEEQFKYTSIPKLKATLPEIIDELSVVYILDEDQRVGLFMHIACLVERLLEGNAVNKLSGTDRIINLFDDDYKVIGKAMKQIEKAFKVIVDDKEIATIIMMIKKI